MKKTRKNPDGTEDVLEGEPEELRKYEDLQKPQEQTPITESPQNPGILHGRPEVDGKPLTDTEIEMVRFLRNFKVPEQKAQPLDILRPYPDPIWITYCSTCGRSSCQGECWGQFQPYPWYTITYSSDKVEPERVSLLVQEDGTSKLSHSLSDVLMGRATLECKLNGN